MAVFLAALMTASQLVSTAWDTVPGDAVSSAAATAPEATETLQDEPEPAPEPLTPRQYLFATYPRLAPRMACVIQAESRWVPTAVNPRSGASGLAQFLRSTWRITPQGRAGLNVFDPYANIDGAAWLATNVGWRQWTVVQFGLC
jgi:soluble lytic murein transglycosylase-like protein